MAHHDIRLEDIFGELEQEAHSFSSYEELERALEQLLNRHAESLPTGYSVRDAVVWARRCGWLEIRDHALRLNTPAARRAA